ncbi:hypothetical protein AAT19DRAFT_14373 [Rhodotorula toruloides]|uniref:Proteophosphoglycan ppg4 n=1 Tax=Rhodotorula toruloides TaxID=5286 RepID=A0A2T0ABH0_RHOTO|nr:hypothetical protein AAT19DRAFT_14373 [Rhodotorula toruloides]
MPVALPLDIALLVVDYAHPRRLDESAVEHLQRLTRLALTLVVGNLANNTGRVLPESSASLGKVVLVGPALVLFFPCDFAKELYPALHSLSLSVRQIRSLPPRLPGPLALTELLLAGPRENLIREFIHPSVTPLLRHLCLLKLDFARTQSPSAFSDIELFRRLEALEISVAHG